MTAASASAPESAPASDPRQPLSQILRDIAEQPEPTISVGELAERFGARATGALLMVFGLACTLPLPPGSTTVFGAPLVLLAPQVAIGARAPWLPARVRAKRVAIDSFRRGLPRVLVWLERFEAISKPRLTFLFGAWGHRAIGAVCTVLALVLIMPIPLGNMLPAASVTVLSFSLVQRDGALALLGYALAASSAGVLVLAAGVILRLLGPVLDFVGLG
jgi:hypothetical protein